MFESLDRKINAARQRAEAERKAAKPMTEEQFEKIDYTARKKHEDMMREIEDMRRKYAHGEPP